ncbi:MAG: hypothetical protein EBZ48_00890 [Proteobacteria bacterium]|nr:hypothetical protein [Pseudomonadota bacterium]
MPKMQAVSPEVLLPSHLIVGVGRDEINFLKAQIPESTKLRTRLCAHLENSDRLHQMFIGF